MKKKIFISGVTGQLGSYLSRLYLERGDIVIGGIRRSANFNPWRLKVMGVLDQITFEMLDLSDQSSIDAAVSKHKPDIFINAAAQSFVGSSWVTGEYTLDVTGIGVYRCLEAIRKHSPSTRFLQMSSSEMFGDNPNYPYNETSLFMPRSPYGIAKCCGYHLVTNFRQSYGMFASNLISFNFESPIRGEEFVTKKIVKEAAKVHASLVLRRMFKESNDPNLTSVTPINLGNLTANRDWIWAGDTARAVSMILDHDKPDDFCVASGVTTSVKEFCNKTFAAFNMPIRWRPSLNDEVIEEAIIEDGTIVVQSLAKLFRPADVPHLIGDATKITNILGWKPSKNLDQIIEEMVRFELDKETKLIV